ncbi:hypothetical protein ADK65_11755 [Streptomyces sp. NRRL B-1140]|uniref:hypothetical protein n=1 Tax=Streptomyces sp. NRRL B-1140 TaxID=1415549 RepID=UPI0006AF652C|nr:hypothetical protein [Streptomyces sp. NRRL B-1140]KOX01017.1 hypothetical protein ADK65_11755 [Streptomyces sp. NRRL B-1140]
MGSLRVTVCTSVLAVVALAPAAYAADTGSVSVTPARPAPGSDVTLRVTGCAQRTAVAASAAFVADARLTLAGAGELVGDSRVRSTLKAGSYAVRVTCGATRRTGTFTVQDRQPGHGAGQSGAPRAAVPGAPPAVVPGAGGRPPAPGKGGQPPAPGKGGQPAVPGKGGQPSAPGTDEEEALSSHRPGAPASPVAPVRAGGGGAADSLAAEGRGAGPGTAQGVTGLVLAGAAAAVVLALRGARRGRGTD